MKTLFALVALIATSVLLATGCSTCCKKDSTKPMASAACPGCTNNLVISLCPGCTNKVTLNLAECTKGGCTNKFSPTLAYNF